MYCIYRITNKVNGNTYIGQHKYNDLNDGYMGSGILITKAKKKYGIENFEKEILYSRIQRKDTADSMEVFAIKKERNIGKAEYNIAAGGQGPLGVPMSEESKRKLSEAKKGRPSTFKGKHLSEEAKAKISRANKGKSHPMAEETRRKISESNKGHFVSEETKRKISEAHKGKHYWTEEMREKHIEFMRNFKHSEESKRKMSEAKKGHYGAANGKHWFNNGLTETYAFECPEGFVNGRLKRGDK